jgi:hypothetical protein
LTHFCRFGFTPGLPETSPLAKPLVPLREKPPAKVAHYHGTPFGFHSQGIFFFARRLIFGEEEEASRHLYALFATTIAGKKQAAGREIVAHIVRT